MKTIILQIALPYIRFFLIFFSIITLLRGHNLPGGGFIGGLMASGAFIFQALAWDVENSKKTLRISPTILIGIGLLTSFLSAIPGILAGKPFLTGTWIKIPIFSDYVLKLGTPLFFDIGVYFTVFGVVLMFIYTLMEEWQWK
jgi:multicomponent Na+:H+ antiporter subunit B